jgi:hypothetical protein
MHIALSHQGLYELLNHVSHYVTRQVSRVDVNHCDQSAIHEGLVWQVSQGLDQCLNRLVSLVLHGVVRSQEVTQLRQVLLDKRTLLVPDSHDHQA